MQQMLRNVSCDTNYYCLSWFMKLQSYSLSRGVKRRRVLTNSSEDYSHQCLLAWELGTCLSFLILSSTFHAWPLSKLQATLPRLSPQCKGGQLTKTQNDSGSGWPKYFSLTPLGRLDRLLLFLKKSKSIFLVSPNPGEETHLSTGTLQEIRNSPWVWWWKGDIENL